MTEFNDASLFDSVQLPPRPDELNPWLVTSVALEMDLSLRIIERNNFSMLDLLSDIGGLSAIFASAAAIIVSIWNWYGLTEIFLLTRLSDLPSLIKEADSDPRAGCYRRRKRRFEAIN